MLYFLTACFALIAVSFTELQGYVAGACLVVVVILTLRLLSNLGVLSFDAEAPTTSRAARAPCAERRRQFG